MGTIHGSRLSLFLYIGERMVNIAIVGAEGKKWTGYDITAVKARIESVLGSSSVLISGRCPYGGVDIWAEEYAHKEGIQMRIFPPQNNWWEPDGYRSRNILIAQNCDIMYVFSPISQEGKVVWNGGIWTGRYAQKIGKEVHYIGITKDGLCTDNHRS